MSDTIVAALITGCLALAAAAVTVFRDEIRDFFRHFFGGRPNDDDIQPPGRVADAGAWADRVRAAGLDGRLPRQFRVNDVRRVFPECSWAAQLLSGFRWPDGSYVLSGQEPRFRRVAPGLYESLPTGWLRPE